MDNQIIKGPIYVIVTCVGGPGGVSVVLSLKDDRRFKLIGVDSDYLSLGLYSTRLSAQYVVPKGDSPDYVKCLTEIVLKHDVKVIFPLSDEEVTTLAKYKKYFCKLGVAIPISDYKIVRLADDKLETIRIAQRAGISVPKTTAISGIGSLKEKDICYPAIIKPRTGRGAEGVVKVGNSIELLDAYGKLAGKYNKKAILQEYIPGETGSIYLFAALYDGERNRASFMSRSIKTKFDFGGPGEGGEPIVNEKLREESFRLLKAFGNWFGPVNVEYKRHSDTGIFYLLEVNPRYWGYSYLATCAGINFPLLTLKLSIGEDIEDQHIYRTDVITLRSNEHSMVDKKRLLIKMDF